MTRRVCETCRHAEPSPNGMYLYCHRYAPRPGWDADGSLAADWPSVDPSARCGEWRWRGAWRVLREWIGDLTGGEE